MYICIQNCSLQGTSLLCFIEAEVWADETSDSISQARPNGTNQKEFLFFVSYTNYQIRGQDAYETCMEKLAEYRIPGTMYINTKKFHEFLKATERPPTVRRWQLSKESTPMSEGSHTSLPTHTQQDHSMFRVHRSGLTRPRSRSNASSTPHFDSPTLPKESQVLIRRADPNVEEKPAAANRSNTLPSSPTLSEHRKHNMLCNELLLMDRQDAIKPSTSKSGDNASEIKLHHNHSIKVTAEKSSVTKSPLSATLNVNIDKPSSYHQPKPKISDMPESPPPADDSQDVFVQVERKKKKKTKVAPRPKPQLLSSPRSETPIQEAAKPTVDQVVACEPQLDAVPPDAWVSSPSPIVESPEEPETAVHSHKHDTAPVSPEQDQKPEQTSLPTVSSPPACAKMPYQEHTGAWYSPFSTGLQLDILPRSRTPQSQQPVYNHYPAASYSHFNGIAMNYRKHYQQSSLPYISRTSSPLNLIGRERMPDYHTMSSSGTQTFTSSPYYTESHETPYGMERRRWRPYIDPEAGEADLEFSLFDKKLPGN